jgi:hypothetical protein
MIKNIFLFLFLVLVIIVLGNAYRDDTDFKSQNTDLIQQYNQYQYGDVTKNLFVKYCVKGNDNPLIIIQTLVDDCATALANDPLLAPVFTVLGQPGHRSGAELKACLDLQFTALLGGPVPYPGRTFTRGVTVLARSMKDSHRSLNIDQAIFNKFVAVVAQVFLDAGVLPADVNAIAPALNGMMSDIVTVNGS